MRARLAPRPRHLLNPDVYSMASIPTARHREAWIRRIVKRVLLPVYMAWVVGKASLGLIKPRPTATLSALLIV